MSRHEGCPQVKSPLIGALRVGRALLCIEISAEHPYTGVPVEELHEGYSSPHS